MSREIEKIRDQLGLIDNPVELLVGIFAYAPVALQIYGADGHCILTNHAFRELFGSVPPPEYNVLRDDVAERAGFIEEIRRAFRGERVEVGPVWYDPRELEHFNVTEGRRVAVACTLFPLHDDSGKLTYVVLMFRDVTAEMLARERAEHAAQRLEESFALVDVLLRTAPVGLAFLDRDLCYVRTNDTLAKINGLPPERHLGRRLREVVPKLAPTIEPHYRKVLETGEPVVNLEVKGETAGRPGEQRHWLVSYYPVRTATGEVVGVGNVVADISDRKALEEELSRTVQRLAEADRLKDEFIAILGHELRNPLAPMVSALDLIELGSLDESVLDRAHAVLARQVRHMKRLVDDLLDLSRVTRGRIQLKREIVSVASVIEKAVDTARPQIDARAHRLVVDAGAESTKLDADPMRLEQCLCNLLTNAAKYTEPGGQIRVGVQARNDQVTISVSDTGMGMAPEEIERMFEPFVRGDGYRTNREGLGIGLTLTRRLVELHGGKIEVWSDGRNRGTTFLVSLPIILDSTSPVPDTPVKPPTVTRKPVSKRILVADDNVDAAALLDELLRKQGHEVRVVHDGAGALRESAEFAPDVVLLDIGLPDMDGHEVARRLREQQSFRNVRLIAVTGFGQEADARRAEAAGFHAHLVKPVDFGVLGALVSDGAE